MDASLAVALKDVHVKERLTSKGRENTIEVMKQLDCTRKGSRKYHRSQEATWEVEADMKSKFVQLFDN